MTSLITILGKDRFNQIKKEIDDEMIKNTKCDELNEYFPNVIFSIINEYLVYELIDNNNEYGYCLYNKSEGRFLKLHVSNTWYNCIIWRYTNGRMVHLCTIE